MQRITNYRYIEAIGYAFSLLPSNLSERLSYVHFFTGTDPVFAGLHDFIDTQDGRSYRNTAHACFSESALNNRERTTIVLPELDDANPYVIVHELGHCLDEILGFSHLAIPINKYAETNRREAFAESFAAQYFWLGLDAEAIFQSDKAIQQLFREIMGGGNHALSK